jgi:Fe-S cluster biogenesis protein NfuA
MTNIYLEESPNPNSLKFVVNHLIVPEGMILDYPDISETGNSPLAKDLFGFDYVDHVFLMNNFVTVTKVDSADWIDIKEELKNFIKTYLDKGKPVIETIDESGGSDQDESEINLRIKSLLDEYVKPAVEQDGGAIEFHSFHEGVVKVLLQGSCSGCPSSTLTLKAGIENLLKSMIPEVTSVEAEGI